MKKIIVTLLLSSTICFSLFSQSITLTAADMPNIGDNYLFDEALPSIQFSPSATGDDYTWDFSDLNSNTQKTDSFLSVLQTPIIYNFVFNNIFDPERATIATNLAALPTFGNFPTPIALSVEYTYYREEDDIYKAVGFAFTADYNGTAIPLPIQYDPIDKLYSFPLNSTTPALTAQSAYEFQIPNLITFREKRNRTTTVDGHGTLLLPNRELQVLRVKSVSVLNDSIRLDAQGGFWLPTQPRTEVEYKWMAQGYGEPVLTIKGSQGFNGTFMPNSVRYRHFEPIPASVTTSAAIMVKAYPVPATQTLVVEAKDIESVALMSLDGKIIAESVANATNTNSIIINLNQNKPAAGLYLLCTTTKTGSAVLKIPIE
jgi:hypothetical protein